MKSKKYSLNQADLIKILKVVGWTVVSAIIASLITLLKETEIPVEYAVWVTMINTFLYTLQKYVSGR